MEHEHARCLSLPSSIVSEALQFKVDPQCAVIKNCDASKLSSAACHRGLAEIQQQSNLSFGRGVSMAHTWTCGLPAWAASRLYGSGGLTTGVGTGDTPLLAGITMLGWPPRDTEVGNEAAPPGFCALLSR